MSSANIRRRRISDLAQRECDTVELARIGALVIITKDDTARASHGRDVI